VAARAVTSALILFITLNLIAALYTLKPIVIVLLLLKNDNAKTLSLYAIRI